MTRLRMHEVLECRSYEKVLQNLNPSEDQGDEFQYPHRPWWPNWTREVAKMCVEQYSFSGFI